MSQYQLLWYVINSLNFSYFSSSKVRIFFAAKSSISYLIFAILRSNLAFSSKASRSNSLRIIVEVLLPSIHILKIKLFWEISCSLASHLSVQISDSSSYSIIQFSSAKSLSNSSISKRFSVPPTSLSSITYLIHSQYNPTSKLFFSVLLIVLLLHAINSASFSSDSFLKNYHQALKRSFSKKN